MTVLRSMKDFSSMNITASILLFVTAIAAAVIANSPAASVYQEFLSHELHFRIGGFNLLSHAGHNLTMIEFINDGLMTIFFLMVGLEIKRELLVGELSSFRKAALPFIAACGGMVVPVVIYSMVCAPGTEGGQGLAIPMATDIAFSLGVLSLLGKRVPLSLKIFLTAFAVVDDIGGILVIAIFYSSHVAYEYLLWAALLYVLLYFIGKKGATNKIDLLPIRLYSLVPLIVGISGYIASNLMIALGYNKYILYSILVTTTIYLFLLGGMYWGGRMNSVISFVWLTFLSYLGELIYRLIIGLKIIKNETDRKSKGVLPEK